MSVSQANRRYTQITKAVYERPWAIQPAMLAVIEEIVRLRAIGSPLTDEEIDARVSAASNGPRRGPQRAQGVAVIPIYGVINQRMNLMSAMSGGTSVEGITRSFREALADPDVGSIVLDIDSPGGAVDGIAELADEIQAARGRKPITAVANTAMDSAAYWLGAAADEVVVTPSGQVGSIGVIGMHHDISRAEEMEGIKTTLISAGEGKEVGNEHAPLTDEGRAELQSMADDYYALFVAGVAESRGVTAATVIDEWKASVFTARKAVVAGLADRVGTLDSVIGEQMAQVNGGGRLAASAPFTTRLAAITDEAEVLVAHAQERARLRAKEGRPGVSVTNREALSALAASLGSIQSDISALLATADPEPAEQPIPEQPAVPRSRANLDLLEAATRGSYALPPREVSTP